MKRIGIRSTASTSEVYSRRLLKERYAEQIDVVGANPPTVFVGKWCSRLRIIQCRNSSYINTNNSFSIRPKPQKHDTPRAVLTTPASEPTTKKVLLILETIIFLNFVFVCFHFLFKFPNWESEQMSQLGLLCSDLNLPSGSRGLGVHEGS